MVRGWTVWMMVASLGLASWASGAMVTDGLAMTWDAASAEATASQWTPSFVAAGTSGQTFSTSDQSLDDVVDAGAALTRAYTFDGTGGAEMSGNFNGNGDTESASWELWIRPAALDQQAVLIDLGGNTNGSSLTIDGTSLKWKTKQSGIELVASGDVLSGTGSFVQVVATIDMAGDEVTLYVDGALVDASEPDGDLTDWAGANTSGLGTEHGGQVGGDTSGDLPTGSFDGQIGQIFFYRDKVLSPSEVQQNYVTFIPEPGTLAMLGVGGLMLLRRRA